MALSKTKPKTKPEKDEDENQEGDQIELILAEKAYKGLHYGCRGGEGIVKPDIIDTGSYLFNEVIGGGYRSGWSRWYSEPEQGKSSQGLLWGANWQKHWKEKGENPFVVIYNAEGRTTSDLITRSKIDTSIDSFRIIDTNSADMIYDVTERLIVNNPENRMYYFMLDSTDACQRSVDIGKTFAEPDKIAGSASVISAAGKRLSLLFSLHRHHLYMCSQIRDKMTTGPNGGGKAPSGGWAAKFYSSLTGKIEKNWSDFTIYEDPADKKSKEIGRLAQIKLEKTYNETTGRVVLVPIRYGHGIWKEYEAMMICQAWQFIKDLGKGRFELTEQFAQELTEAKVAFEPKFHGIKAMRNYFDATPELVEYVFNKMKLIEH